MPSHFPSVLICLRRVRKWQADVGGGGGVGEAVVGKWQAEVAFVRLLTLLFSYNRSLL